MYNGSIVSLVALTWGVSRDFAVALAPNMQCVYSALHMFPYHSVKERWLGHLCSDSRDFSMFWSSVFSQDLKSFLLF